MLQDIFTAANLNLAIARDNIFGVLGYGTSPEHRIYNILRPLALSPEAESESRKLAFTAKLVEKGWPVYNLQASPASKAGSLPFNLVGIDRRLDLTHCLLTLIREAARGEAEMRHFAGLLDDDPLCSENMAHIKSRVADLAYAANPSHAADAGILRVLAECAP